MSWCLTLVWLVAGDGRAFPFIRGGVVTGGGGLGLLVVATTGGAGAGGAGGFV